MLQALGASGAGVVGARPSSISGVPALYPAGELWYPSRERRAGHDTQHSHPRPHRGEQTRSTRTRQQDGKGYQAPGADKEDQEKSTNRPGPGKKGPGRVPGPGQDMDQDLSVTNK